MESYSSFMMMSSSAFFPTPSHEELSYDLIDAILQNTDTSFMSNQERNEFIDSVYYNSPISPIHNIGDPTISANPQYSFMPTSTTQPQYQPQQPFYMPHVSSYNPPQYYPMPQYAPPVAYMSLVGIAIVNVADETLTTYEDILELEEQMDQVNVGLSEETISKNLKTSRIHDVKEDGEGEVCAVCQEEYRVKETIGTLECGHRYHANCIKDWLLQKNVCPICKATALDI